MKKKFEHREDDLAINDGGRFHEFLESMKHDHESDRLLDKEALDGNSFYHSQAERKNEFLKLEPVLGLNNLSPATEDKAIQCEIELDQKDKTDLSNGKGTFDLYRFVKDEVVASIPCIIRHTRMDPEAGRPEVREGSRERVHVHGIRRRLQRPACG